MTANVSSFGRWFLGYLTMTVLGAAPVNLLMLVAVWWVWRLGFEISFTLVVAILALGNLVMSALMVAFCFGPVWFFMHKMNIRRSSNAFFAAFLTFAAIYAVLLWLQFKTMSRW